MTTVLASVFVYICVKLFVNIAVDVSRAVWRLEDKLFSLLFSVMFDFELVHGCARVGTNQILASRSAPSRTQAQPQHIALLPAALAYHDDDP